MDIERRTAANTAIVLIDYVSGFAPLIGSQTIAENTAGGRALVQTAHTFGVPLVVSTGPRNDPRGVLYPEITEVLDGHPVVHRGLSFDAFEDGGFERAVAATGMRHLVIAGLMTDGCVMQTTLSALRRDYDVSLVVDATASDSAASHNAALTRFTQLGVTPRSWLSFASELQRSYEHTGTLAGFRAIQSNMPGYAMLNASLTNVREILANASS
ncbi:isochorismatase family protein [Nonomuraea lactucae]|uniref:isochorismatase family protein n=1 Tax=Nonomuraea lactucae TaxID=2249762 RepID=UPI000DE25197|nr:isochorismatase family protein [Nonomuraea lactucae]